MTPVYWDAMGQFWDSDVATLGNIQLQCVTDNILIALTLFANSLILEHYLPPSHGRGHWFDPSTAHQRCNPADSISKPLPQYRPE